MSHFMNQKLIKGLEAESGIKQFRQCREVSSGTGSILFVHEELRIGRKILGL